MQLELGELVVEEILKEKRLGSKGFARIRINLLLELPFEVLFHCLSCYYLDSSFWRYWRSYLLMYWSLEVRSEVATSDLEWRRVRMHKSPCF